MVERAGTGEEQQAIIQLQQAILACDAEAAKTAAAAVIAQGIDPAFALDRGIRASADLVSAKFDSGEYFLPHLVMAGDAMIAAAAVLEAAMPKDKIQAKKVVVIGTVEGDMHSVGKNIVAMMLSSGGFEVHDLGVDVKADTIIAKAKEVKADIIALSSLLTTTMPYQREVLEVLEGVGIRQRFKVMVGGGPVTKEWADKIGADGYGRDAAEALAVARALVQEDATIHA